MRKDTGLCVPHVRNPRERTHTCAFGAVSSNWVLEGTTFVLAPLGFNL